MCSHTLDFSERFAWNGILSSNTLQRSLKVFHFSRHCSLVHRNNRFFLDNSIDINSRAFHNGMSSMVNLAAVTGVRVPGLVFPGFLSSAREVVS